MLYEFLAYQSDVRRTQSVIKTLINLLISREGNLCTALDSYPLSVKMLSYFNLILFYLN